MTLCYSVEGATHEHDCAGLGSDGQKLVIRRPAGSRDALVDGAHDFDVDAMVWTMRLPKKHDVAALESQNCGLCITEVVQTHELVRW
jgi:hypothetical protein